MTNNVILVEDDDSIRESYQMLIETVVPDTTVSSFKSGHDFFKALAVDEPHLHSAKAICLDGYLDTEHGYERGWDIARELRKEFGYKGPIILTGALGNLKFPAGPMSQAEAFLSDEVQKMDILSKEEGSHFDYLATKPDSRALTKILNDIVGNKQ